MSPIAALVTYVYSIATAVNNIASRVYSLESGNGGQAGTGNGGGTIATFSFPQYVKKPLVTLDDVLLDYDRIPDDSWESNSTLPTSNTYIAGGVDPPLINMGAAEDYWCWMNDPALHGQGPIWLAFSLDANYGGLITMIQLRCCNGARGTNARIQVSKDAAFLNDGSSGFAVATWTTLHVVDNTKWTPSAPVVGTPLTFEDYVAVIPVTTSSEWWKLVRIVFDDYSTCSYDLFAVSGVPSNN